MSVIQSRYAAAVAHVSLSLLAACAGAGTPPSTTATPATAATSSTLLVRLGADTVAMEQYTRTPTHMEGMVVSRTPQVLVARYSVDLGAGNAPTRFEYSARRGDGTPVAGQPLSLVDRFAGDSLYLTATRATGDTARSIATRGELTPYINNSYGLYELALARLLATGRDSAQYAVVPPNFSVATFPPLPIRRVGSDSARITWFGSPLLVRHDGRGNLMGVDASRTTAKVRVDRVATTDLGALATSWTAREKAGGAAGPASTRDTVRANIGAANVWIDYGRPALRGRNVWVNGVLGDTLWRTGANAATQLRTDATLSIGGATVPAGTYTLWTATTASGYQLVINKQFGQWGTEYAANRDLARVPLAESATPAAFERFTIGLAPQDGAQSARSGLLTLAWGTKQLSVPVTAR
jgi:hypothetical protein